MDVLVLELFPLRPNLITRIENGIGWVIFNNPEKRNAMSMDMTQAMGAALEDYARTLCADPPPRARSW